MRHHNDTTHSGFALLMTLIVVSVVISVGLTLIDLTIKQLRLSTGSRDSEVAFHAANAGVECARYWRLASSTAFEEGTGDAVPMLCFGALAPVSPTKDTDPVFNGPDDIYKYDVQFSWGSGSAQRCSQITMVTLSSNPTSAGVSLSDVPNYVEGYPEQDKNCIAGGRCTILSVRGFNKPCASINQVGTVQREVLLEL